VATTIRAVMMICTVILTVVTAMHGIGVTLMIAADAHVMTERNNLVVMIATVKTITTLARKKIATVTAKTACLSSN